TPGSRRTFEVRTGRVPLAHINGKRRLVHDPGVAALQPVVEPAYRFVAPFHPRLRVGFMRPGVRPGTDPRLHRRVEVLQHARQAVAIPVVPAAYVEARDPEVGI